VVPREEEEEEEEEDTQEIGLMVLTVDFTYI
jgi:hypothetical protein